MWEASFGHVSDNDSHPNLTGDLWGLGAFIEPSVSARLSTPTAPVPGMNPVAGVCVRIAGTYLGSHACIQLEATNVSRRDTLGCDAGAGPFSPSRDWVSEGRGGTGMCCFLLDGRPLLLGHLHYSGIYYCSARESITNNTHG